MGAEEAEKSLPGGRRPQPPRISKEKKRSTTRRFDLQRVESTLPDDVVSQRSSVPKDLSSEAQTFDFTRAREEVTVYQDDDVEELVWNDGSAVFNTKQGSLSEHYDVGEELAAGGFGTVSLAKKKHARTHAFVVKSIPVKNLTSASDEIMELTIFSMLDHPHVLKLRAIFREKEHLHLVMDRCSGGDLFDCLLSSMSLGFSDGLPTRWVAKYAWQMLAGISYIHHHRFAHRDIKLENFMLRDETQWSQIVLIDFGLACRYTKGEKMSDNVGTSGYQAPELIRQRYDEKCDLWSTGVTLWVLLLGTQPFEAEDEKEMEKHVLDNSYDPVKEHEKCFSTERQGCEVKIPDAMVLLLQDLLQRDPEVRPGAKQIIKDNKWLHSYRPGKVACCAII